MSFPDLSTSKHVVELLGGLSELIDLAEARIGGLPALQLTVELAESATGAFGATFVEYTRAGGRVVVATHELSWALGRPVEAADAGRTSSGRADEISVESLAG